MAVYNLWVPTFRIRQIRSNDQDTLSATMALRVMNAEGGLHMDWPPITSQFGTHVAGDFVRPFQLYQNVDVPDPTPESADGGAIYWTYILVNAGHPDVNTLINSLASAGDAVAGALIGSAFGNGPVNPVPVIIGSAIAAVDALARLLTTGCDGAVASQSWAITAAQLASMTTQGQIPDFTLNYPGTASPFQCGPPSSYDVEFTITSQPPVRVPQLLDLSPDDASKIAQKAGLRMVIIAQATGGPDLEQRTVGWQDPWAGTFVPTNTAIEVVVDVPPKLRP